MNPSFLLAYIGISDAYRIINDYENSIRYLSAATKIETHNSLLLSSKASLLIDQKKFLNALTSLKKAIKINVNNDIALMKLCILFRLKKK